MEKFSIKIIDPREKKYYRTFCLGEIQINELQETFEMPLKEWSQQDYKQQWKDGIKRIKTHDQSCFVVELDLSKTSPRAHLWVLYKDNNIVHIQNIILFGKNFIKLLKKKSFTHETCYDFITQRETISEDGDKFSEWDVDLESILHYKV